MTKVHTHNIYHKMPSCNSLLLFLFDDGEAMCRLFFIGMTVEWDFSCENELLNAFYVENIYVFIHCSWILFIIVAIGSIWITASFAFYIQLQNKLMINIM